VTCRTIHHCLGCRARLGFQTCNQWLSLRHCGADGTRAPVHRRLRRRVPSASGRVAGHTHTKSMRECVCPVACPACVLRVSTLHLGHGVAVSTTTRRCDRPSARPGEGSLRMRLVSSRRPIAALRAALDTFAAFASRSSANLAGA
jgi:hypothetical protein